MPLTFSDQDQKILLSIAKTSIEHGLQTGTPLSVAPSEYPQALREILSSFVTLHLKKQLRGCIGALEARESLVVDVAKHAFAAAFHDPRFPSLNQNEFASIELEISILSPQQEIPCESEAQLLQQLRPGTDGLVIRDGVNTSTFLPSVWEQIPEPQAFLSQLKIKAGLLPTHWSANFKAYRYTTLSFNA